MKTVALYRARADECHRRATEAKLRPDQLHWDQLARAWLKLAEGECLPTGSKGVGEIGIVGTAAAIANAAFHATGIRVRDLPVTIDKILGLRQSSTNT